MPPRGGGLHDAADNGAVGEHVVIVLAPFARRTARRGTLEDQLLRHERAPTTPLISGPLWRQNHACHVAAGWALIPDQSRLTYERRDPHHLVHCGFASRTGKAAF